MQVSAEVPSQVKAACNQERASGRGQGQRHSEGFVHIGDGLAAVLRGEVVRGGGQGTGRGVDAARREGQQGRKGRVRVLARQISEQQHVDRANRASNCGGGVGIMRAVQEDDAAPHAKSFQATGVRGLQGGTDACIGPEKAEGGHSERRILKLVLARQRRRVGQGKQVVMGWGGVEGSPRFGGHPGNHSQRFARRGGQQGNPRQRGTGLVAGNLGGGLTQDPGMVQRDIRDAHGGHVPEGLRGVAEATHTRFHDGQFHMVFRKGLSGKGQRQVEESRVRGMAFGPADELRGAVRGQVHAARADPFLVCMEVGTGKAAHALPGGQQPGFQHGAGAALAVRTDDPDTAELPVRATETVQQFTGGPGATRAAGAGAGVEPVVVWAVLVRVEGFRGGHAPSVAQVQGQRGAGQTGERVDACTTKAPANNWYKERMASGRSPLKTLLRVTRALTDDDASRSAGQESGRLGTLARRAADTVRHDPRVHEGVAGVREGWRERVTSLRTAAQDRADAHLERLVTESAARRGEGASGEVAALLEARRTEREARQAVRLAREALLAHARSVPERRVLTLLADHTPWAGGERSGPLKYTTLLDTLAPGGRAEDEMKIHRALWTLAEERVLAVSPHGEITASR